LPETGQYPRRRPDDDRRGRAEGEKIADAYARRNMAEAIERICRLAEAGNLYLQNAAPWER
jgi:methionyl-tRNA synthetase